MGLLDNYYQESLGRAPDAAGKKYWQGQIDSGKMTTDQVKSSLYNSAEAKQGRFNSGAARAEAQNGKSPLNAMQAPEGDNKTQIENLYRTQLGREADKDGLDYWMNEASTKGMDSVTGSFGNTKEVQGYQSFQRKPGIMESGQGWEDPRFSAQMRTVNAETDTVQGQLGGLLEQENPLMQRAYYKGLDYANSRGLVDSSMGSEAAQAAMMDAALPIAQQDASTYYDQGKTNQGYTNQFNLNDRQYLQNVEQNELQRDHEYNLQQQTDATNREIEATKQDAGLYAQFLKGVSDINAANLEQGEKDAAVQSLWNQYQAGSQIGNSLRYISVNADGTVNRTEVTAPDVDSAPGLLQGGDNVTAMIYGQGVYTQGVTRDSAGNLVDKDGRPFPGENYKLMDGLWIPSQNTYDWGAAGGR